MARPAAPTMAGVRIAALVVLLFAAGARAGAPSAFPEHAVELRGGWSGTATIAAGAEVLLPVRYLDVAAGAEAVFGLDGRFGARLTVTGLLFPTLGTTPPLALGVGGDLSWRDDTVRVHLGPVVGLDLLYVSELPAVIDVYLAPGYGFGRGPSLAWTAQARYYLDSVALVLSSSDLVPLSLGVRVPF